MLGIDPEIRSFGAASVARGRLRWSARPFLCARFYSTAAAAGFEPGAACRFRDRGCVSWRGDDVGVPRSGGSGRIAAPNAATFEARAEQLGAQALAPGSPLACLNALAGDGVETACEKAMFVSPASVAAASSYVARAIDAPIERGRLRPARRCETSNIRSRRCGARSKTTVLASSLTCSRSAMDVRARLQGVYASAQCGPFTRQPERRDTRSVVERHAALWVAGLMAQSRKRASPGRRRNHRTSRSISISRPRPRFRR